MFSNDVNLAFAFLLIDIVRVTLHKKFVIYFTTGQGQTIDTNKYFATTL